MERLKRVVDEMAVDFDELKLVRRNIWWQRSS